MTDADMGLVYRTFRTLLDDGDEASTEPGFIRDHWLPILNTIANTQTQGGQDVSAEFEGILRRAEPFTQLISLITSGEFETNDSSLYLGALHISDDSSLAAWAARGLAALRAERWAKALKDDTDDVANLAFEVAQHGTDLDLATSFLDGLTQHQVTP